MSVGVLFWCLAFMGIGLGALGLLHFVGQSLTEDFRTVAIRVAIVIGPVALILVLGTPFLGPMFALTVGFMGLVPMIFYTTLLWWIDHWEREPWYLIAAAFVWGAVPGMILAIIAERTVANLLSTGVFYGGTLEPLLVMVVFVAPIVEESIKAVALLVFFLVMRQHIDSILDGLIYGAAVGFGFAAVENIMYFIAPTRYGGLPALLYIAFYRAFIFGMAHSFFTGMTGLGFGLARFRTSLLARIACPLSGLLLAMLLHGFYNWTAFSAMFHPYEGSARLVRLAVIHGTGIAGIILFMVVSLLVQRHWVRRYLREEVDLGVLTPDQALAASSIVRSWTGCGLERRLNQLCAKLAMMHHALARVGQRGASIVEIETLRKRVARLSRRLRVAATV